jgi:hypothetical protein
MDNIPVIEDFDGFALTTRFSVINPDGTDILAETPPLAR